MDISLPEGFVKRIKRDLGEDAESFLRSFYDVPKRGLRINPLKVNADAEAEITCGLKRVPWEEHGYYYEDGGSVGVAHDGSVSADSKIPRPGQSPLHAAGAYYIQEPSAMAPVNYLDVRPGMCVLDLCAAPGGKSTQIASKLKGNGLIVSNEIIPDRARILSQNIERMGIKNALVISHDPRELSLRFPASFDRILADAPCSGEGMFRRDDTAVREWSEDNVRMCAERQEMILDQASVMLKPGGRLVYSTCTFSMTENEEQVENFLKKHTDFHLLSAYQYDGMRENGGMIRIWPQDGYGEGHFMAVFERDGELLPEAYGYKGSTEPVLSNKQKQETGPWKDFITDVFADGSLKDSLSDPKNLFIFGSRLCAMPESTIPILAGLKTIRAGLELGGIRKGRFVPSHSLALALRPGDVLRNVELNSGNAGEGDMAGQYLNGQTLKDPAVRDNGWTVVSISGISLGWVKSSNGLLKNHYPKGLRLYQ